MSPDPFDDSAAEALGAPQPPAEPAAQPAPPPQEPAPAEQPQAAGQEQPRRRSEHAGKRLILFSPAPGEGQHATYVVLCGEDGEAKLYPGDRDQARGAALEDESNTALRQLAEDGGVEIDAIPASSWAPARKRRATKWEDF